MCQCYVSVRCVSALCRCYVSVLCQCVVRSCQCYVSVRCVSVLRAVCQCAVKCAVSVSCASTERSEKSTGKMCADSGRKCANNGPVVELHVCDGDAHLVQRFLNEHQAFLSRPRRYNSHHATRAYASLQRRQARSRTLGSVSRDRRNAGHDDRAG